MTNTIHQHYSGINGMQWFTGIVEDRSDPLQLGRVKIRVHGHHTDDRSLIPTTDLPWAMPMLPVTAGGGVGGVGESVSIMIGALVLGFWMDYPDNQIPMVMGIIGPIETGFSGRGSGGAGQLMRPDGTINDQIPAGGPGTINPVGTGPRWLQIAQGEAEKKIREWPGSSHNPEVLKYGKEFGFTTDDSSHPWCTVFVHWCLKQAGVSVAGINANSQSIATAPSMRKLSSPVHGCIVVHGRDADGYGHAGFWVGRAGGKDKLLGGNQSNAVNVSSFGTSRLRGYYWPAGEPMPAAMTATGE